MKKLVILAVVMIFCFGVYFAEANTGTIDGTVCLEDGSAVPGVAVSLKGSKGERQTTITNENGYYVFRNVPPGTYQLTFQLEGFKTLIHNNITVSADNTTTIDVDMEVGKIIDGIEAGDNLPVVPRTVDVYRESGKIDDFLGGDKTHVVTGTIDGTVGIDDGNVVPGVDVSLEGPNILRRTTMTNENGYFVFRNIPPGMYQLTYALEGFKEKKVRNIYVPAGKTSGKTATVNVIMENGCIAEEIQVVANLPIVDIKSNRSGVNISKDIFEKLLDTKHGFMSGEGGASWSEYVSGDWTRPATASNYPVPELLPSPTIRIH
ncbi:MAG: carboxypeptidase regulatory-like domain-containing protein [bacterium]|nr:carboxypeptidase regulatory-like domain-containing protein [bacterium]